MNTDDLYRRRVEELEDVLERVIECFEHTTEGHVLCDAEGMNAEGETVLEDVFLPDSLEEALVEATDVLYNRGEDEEL